MLIVVSELTGLIKESKSAHLLGKRPETALHKATNKVADSHCFIAFVRGSDLFSHASNLYLKPWFRKLRLVTCLTRN